MGIPPLGFTIFTMLNFVYGRIFFVLAISNGKANPYAYNKVLTLAAAVLSMQLARKINAKMIAASELEDKEHTYVN